jgi:DNA polymerase III subunit beta
MIFQTTRGELLELVSFSNRTINPRTSTFILNGVLLEAEDKLTVFSTDLETSIKSSMDVKIEETGKAVVPAKILINILKSLKETKIYIELNKETNQLQITGDNAFFSLNTLSLEEFPSFPEIKEQKAINIDLEEFADLVMKVQRAASQDESRAILTGILMEIIKNKLTLVATDSYRLALVTKDLENKINEIKIVVPSRVLEGITRDGFKNKSLEIMLEEKQIIFYLKENGEAKNIIISRLLSGKYPEYKNLIPEKTKHNILINKERILDVVRRISSISQDNIPVKIVIDEGRLTATMDIKEVGRSNESLEVAYGEERIETAFNPYYLIDGITMMDSKNIIFSIEEPLKPILIRPEGDEKTTYLLMPIRIS